MHRYIHFVIYSLTPFFCVLTIHYNADQIHVKTSEILHVNRFSSKLVHRYIIYSLTPFFCVLTIHYNADQIHVKTPILHVNRFSSELVHRYIIYSLTPLLRGEATHLL